MNNLLAIFFLLSMLSCSNENPNTLPTEKPKTTEANHVIDELYEITFQLDSVDNETYNLVLAMKLKHDSYFVSPHSPGGFKGRFGISIEDNPHMEMDTAFIETPLSVEEFDPHPFVNGPINWVRINTSYEHTIHLKSKEDFDVMGLVRFTIEPRCTLEEVDYIIKYRNGKLIVEKFMC